MKPRTNQEWTEELAGEGETQAAAIEDLRAYLRRAALYSLGRYQGEVPQLGPADLETLAEDCAQEALLAIMRRLPEFRSESKVTTWAYKFAVNFALVALRRERWSAVSLDQVMETDDWPQPPILEDRTAAEPERAALRGEVWATVREVISQELTERQRQALKAVAFDEVPLDEVARHFGTNRNAVYKLVHDARRNLKARLEARGLTLEEISDLFASAG